MKRIGCFLICIFNCYYVAAQGRTSNWYFGYGAGIRFENYSPFFLLDNGIDTIQEGCAAISKSNGELMYYGSPELAFNRQHDTLHNGAELAGNFSSTQGALFIPNPLDTDVVYYVNQLPSHVYSIVRTTESFPLGEILAGEKNILLKDSSSEKTTAVHHANGKDIWIILRDNPEDTMLAFLVTENGINPNPVKSALPYGYYGAQGQLKSSPNGKFLAESTGAQYSWNNHYQAFLYKFNNATGVVSETLPISDTLLFSYGCEFSANSKYVYFTNYFASISGGIFQYSLENFDSTSIQNSRYIHSVSYGNSMQIGIDQKIYIVKIFGSHLDRIENPNEYGANLIHTDSAVYLGGVLSTLGLPDFIQSYFRPAYFDYTSKCGLPVKFQAQNHLYDSLRWDFGDSASASNTDTAAKTQHQYPGTGWYTVRLIVHSDSSADTFSRLIFSRSSEIFVAQKDTIVVCEQDSTALSSHRSNSTTQYIWNTGDTIDSIEVNLFGTYFCTVTSPCDSVVDTFIVVYASPPTLNLDSHAVICEGDTLFLTAENGQQSSFLWSTGDTTSQIAVGSWLSPNLDELEISVTASNVCLSITDTILIGFIPLPNASLPPDTNQCLNESIFLQHEALSEVTYYWSDSSQALAFRVDSTSLVWLSASNMCGTDRDSILVTFHPEMEVELGPNAQICAGQEVILNASWPQSSYQWNQVPAGQSISDSVLFVQDAGNYIVTITNGPCALVEQQEITLIENCDSTECKFSIPNVFSPNADGINDLLDISNACKTLAYDIYIYNRWGQLVHFSTEAFSSWDGFINGVPASSGTYFLMVEYQDENGQPRYQKASFALVR